MNFLIYLALTVVGGGVGLERDPAGGVGPVVHVARQVATPVKLHRYNLGGRS
mgnify:CR=1 FL=1